MNKKLIYTVYIVDDVEDTTDMLADFLSNSGFKTRAFSSGEEPLRILETTTNKETSPDLILLDFKMPGINGIEMIKRIRANSKIGYIPIIMMTSSNETEYRIKGLQSGADDFLNKPFNLEELLARVNSFLRLKQFYDEKTDLLNEVQQAYDKLATAQSERVETEKQKLQMDAMLTTAAGICHEMSQPLTTALITLQLAKQSQNNTTFEDFDTIESNLLQMRVILDKLRALTRFETKPYSDQERILDLDRSSDKIIIKTDNEFNGNLDDDLSRN